MEFEEQQVSLSLRDSSRHSDRSQQCSSLDDLHSASYFQVLQSLYQSFSDYSKSTNRHWYNRHFHVSQFFLVLYHVEKSLIFVFFQFYCVVSPASKSTIQQVIFLFLFLLIIIRSGCQAEIRWSVCISKSLRSLCISFSRIDSELFVYHCLNSQTSISYIIPNGSPYPFSRV